MKYCIAAVVVPTAADNVADCGGVVGESGGRASSLAAEW